MRSLQIQHNFETRCYREEASNSNAVSVFGNSRRKREMTGNRISGGEYPLWGCTGKTQRTDPQPCTAGGRKSLTAERSRNGRLASVRRYSRRPDPTRREGDDSKPMLGATTSNYLAD